MKLLHLSVLIIVLAMIAAACGGGALEAAADCDGEIASGTVVEVWMHEGSAEMAALVRQSVRRRIQMPPRRQPEGVRSEETPGGTGG